MHKPAASIPRQPSLSKRPLRSAPASIQTTPQYPRFASRSAPFQVQAAAPPPRIIWRQIASTLTRNVSALNNNDCHPEGTEVSAFSRELVHSQPLAAA